MVRRSGLTEGSPIRDAWLFVGGICISILLAFSIGRALNWSLGLSIGLLIAVYLIAQERERQSDSLSANHESSTVQASKPINNSSRELESSASIRDRQVASNVSDVDREYDDIDGRIPIRTEQSGGSSATPEPILRNYVDEYLYSPTPTDPYSILLFGNNSWGEVNQLIRYVPDELPITRIPIQNIEGRVDSVVEPLAGRPNKQLLVITGLEGFEGDAENVSSEVEETFEILQQTLVAYEDLIFIVGVSQHDSVPPWLVSTFEEHLAASQ